MKRKLLKEIWNQALTENYDERYIRETCRRSTFTDNGITPKGYNNLVTVIEEASELIKEITKSIRKKKYDKFGMMEELADCMLGTIYLEEILDITSDNIDGAALVCMNDDTTLMSDLAIIKELSRYIVMLTALTDNIATGKTADAETKWAEESGIPTMKRLVRILCHKHGIPLSDLRKMMMIKTQRVQNALTASQTKYHDDMHFEDFM